MVCDKEGAEVAEAAGRRWDGGGTEAGRRRDGGGIKNKNPNKDVGN